ncbi:MAG: histidine phosphatase family protein [Candidatus Saccharimonadales bacterium]
MRSFCYTDFDMFIYLVRHGQSHGNVNFVPGVHRPKTDPLTKLGLTQAENAVSTIRSKKIKPEIIISSPYTRTLDTAITIQKKLNIPLVEDARLGEYDPGDWDGMRVDDFMKKFNEINLEKRYIFRPPNGESWLDEANRMYDAIKEAESNGNTCIVIVSHYDPIKAVINLLTKLPASDWPNLVDYPPGSVSVLNNNHSGWTVI